MQSFINCCIDVILNLHCVNHLIVIKFSYISCLCLWKLSNHLAGYIPYIRYTLADYAKRKVQYRTQPNVSQQRQLRRRSPSPKIRILRLLQRKNICYYFRYKINYDGNHTQLLLQRLLKCTVHVIRKSRLFSKRVFINAIVSTPIMYRISGSILDFYKNRFQVFGRSRHYIFIASWVTVSNVSEPLIHGIQYVLFDFHT
jgi:hypothetical protein